MESATPFILNVSGSKRLDEKTFNLLIRYTYLFLKTSLLLVKKRDLDITEFMDNTFNSLINGRFYIDRILLMNNADAYVILSTSVIQDISISFKTESTVYISDEVIFNYDLIEKSIREFITNSVKREQYKQKTYLVHDPSNSLYKIGRSADPNSRFKGLTTSNVNLTLISTCEIDIESELHQKYSQKRTQGEWFNLSADDVLDVLDLFKSENQKLKSVSHE